MTLFQGKYRSESTRLKSWDYSAAGYYFVTICTQGQKCCLGEISEGIIKLSLIGCIVAEEWLRTADLRGNVRLDEWVIMPNHVHGIICIIETGSDAPKLPEKGTIFGPQRNNLASIVRGFKGASTKRIHGSGTEFAWQPRFYDEIIGAEKSLETIQNYIKDNPVQWELDRYNPKNRGNPL